MGIPRKSLRKKIWLGPRKKVGHRTATPSWLWGVARVLAAQSCPTLWDPMECNPPGPSVHGIFQTRILEWVAIPFSRGSSRPRDQTQVSSTAGRFFTVWTTGKSQWRHSVPGRSGYKLGWVISGQSCLNVAHGRWDVVSVRQELKLATDWFWFNYIAR